MYLIMGFKDFLARLREKKEGIKDMEMMQNAQERFEAKKLSSEERELGDYLEEDRQKKIKELVKKIRHDKNRETWSGRKFNPIFAENVIANQPKLFSAHSMFSDAPNLFKQDDNLFFKW